MPPGQEFARLRASGRTDREQDLEGLLDCLMNHPNTAPFIAAGLIGSLVTSNPSPGYIQRIAAGFSNNGFGVRGDLKAVARAILTDVEARDDNATVNSGRLKEPILHIAGLLRALNGHFSSSHQLSYLFEYMAQSPLNPPSVFSWFSPLYRVPKSPLFGPEFQIYTPTEATLRGNFFHYLLSSPNGDLTVNLAPFHLYGNDLPGWWKRSTSGCSTDECRRDETGFDQRGGARYDAKTRIETAYLTALCGQYAVQH